ncbi:MAG TPA: c-type cytochrome domain-containing protein, partial [Planctomycetaceae bacterium]|nr:c-type cytochrome domain-containing protein [Planctomycetaceae bacterium]
MRTIVGRFFIVGVWLSLPAVSATRLCADEAEETFFETRIRPVLAQTCFRCHGGQKTNGKLRVDSFEALLNGGETGPAIKPGQPEQSLLIKALRREDGVSAMPPDKPVPDEVIADFAKWIKAGAKWPAKVAAFRSEQHWAFVPPRAITDFRSLGDFGSLRGDNPIDMFLEQ